MAPARRKGLGRASAEVSAKEWKIGDLVLAKMKGFPAWPAVIHDPKRWGYSSNRKKLLVFFFGTKQIAFCNHVDLQAFTDERKKTLLNKRQSKGGDFSRAVREIVECYDSLHKKKCDDHFNSSDEGAVLDTENLKDSSCRFSTRSTDIIESQRYSSLIQSSGISNLKETLQSDMDQPSEKVSIIDELRQTPFSTNSSFKRVRKALSLSCTIHKKTPSVRKSRSSIKADSSFKLKTCDIHANKLDLSDISMICNVAQDELADRNKLSKESLDNSVCKNVDIHSLLTSETVHDDILPGVITTNSQKVYFENDELSQVKSADENSSLSCPDKSNKMNGRAGDKRMKVVVKKTKKSHKSTLSCCSMEETKFKVVAKQDLSNSVRQCKNIIERFNKIGHSDEHLPFVKRARVRMGEASLVEKQFDNVIKSPGEASIKTEKVDLTCSDKDSILISDYSFRESMALDATNLNISSSSNDCIKSKVSVTPLKAAPHPFRVISVDSEAALPPSKRLNRALEAMSANVAEAKDDSTKAIANNAGPRDIWNEVPDVLAVVSNGVSNSLTVAPFIPLDNNNVRPQEMQEKCSSANSVLNATSRPSLHPSLEISSGLIANDSCLVNRIFEEQECTITSASCSPIHSSSTEINKAEVFISEPCLSEGTDKSINDVSCSNTVEISSPTIKCERNITQIGMVDKDNKDQCFCAQVCEEIDRSGHSGSPKIMVESCTIIPQNCLYTSIPATSQHCEESNKSIHSDTQELKVDNSIVFQLNNTSGSHPVAFECSMSDVPENAIFPNYGCKANYRENKMKLSAIELNDMHTSKDLVFSPDFCLPKVSNADSQARPNFLHSSSLPNSATNVKISSDILSSPSPLFLEDSSEHLSSHSEKTNYQNSSNNSPNFNLQPKNSTHQLDNSYGNSESFTTNQQKVLNKSSGSNEANAALKYFDGLVCVLTRAKDSIARATQCAIDCSKLFVSSEVVEILLRHLEKEQSFHKKIDMFFLADSIIRYTRGQKNVAGDVYPPLFQSVLGRLITSTAPSGISSWENRRQCLKVLKLWLDRKTFSESILRHHIRALESINEEPFNNVFCRRLLRRERPLDDPAREMEGMLVDEYGSNTSFELPGLLNSQIFKGMDDGSDIDEKIFEAVTPEHDPKISENKNTVSISSNMTGQRKHILEDVDGELEMEDVSPPSDHAVDVERHHYPVTFTPPLPNDKPPSPPPLPSSPPPNMQIHIQHSNTRLIEQNIQKVSSSSDAAALPCYTPGYRDHSNHIPPHSPSLSSSCTYGNNNSSSHLTSVQCINNPQLGNAASLNTAAYHLQPPPPPEVSSQFSYMPPDPHNNLQPWFGNGRHVGNDYSDRIRMMQQRESCDYSSSILPGHLPTESTEPSCSISYYGPPHNSSLIPNPNWPHPLRESNYQYSRPPLHRPMENHMPRKTRAPGFWRP